MTTILIPLALFHRSWSFIRHPGRRVGPAFEIARLAIDPAGAAAFEADADEMRCLFVALAKKVAGFEIKDVRRDLHNVLRGVASMNVVVEATAQPALA